MIITGSIQPTRRTTSTVVVAMLVAMVTLAGCVSVPTTGQIEKVEGQQQTCQNCVSVEVSPPAIGAEPKQIVEGFLRATSNYQPNYSVAKQFLTTPAAEKWSPEAGASIFSGTVVATGASVILDGQLLGSLGPDRTYTARDQRLRVNFGLVRQDNEWRISSPPAGLMVQEYSFKSFYQRYNLYFIGNGSSLVPDPIYLPNLRNQTGVASVLMRALLSGPSKWLKPAVSTAIPADTTLSVDSVTISDGIAEVALSEAVLQLGDEQRSLLAAQVVYTLKQAAGVKAVKFTVAQQPLVIPEADTTSFAVAVDSYRELDPVPFVAGEQLYAVRGAGVELVGTNADAPTGRPMPGALGEKKLRVDRIAVSVANTDVAVVTDDRTKLRRTAANGGEVITLIDGVTELLRPQFSRYGELWAIGRKAGKQRLWMIAGDKLTEIASPVLGSGDITAFKISPDGTRIAFVRRTGEKVQLGLARITRADRFAVDGWRTLTLTGSRTPNLTRLRDVGWLDATQLMVLAAPAGTGPIMPYTVIEDASSIVPDGETVRWDAAELSVLLRTKTVVVVSADGQTYRNDGDQWLPFIDKAKTVAFPG